MVVKIGTRNTLVDLGAEKLIAAERGVEKIAVVSRDPNHFMLLQEGWEDQRRVHGTFTVESRAAQPKQSR